MKEIADLETALESIAATMNWRAVMQYEHGRLIGISMGTITYVSDMTGVTWSAPNSGNIRHLRLVTEDDSEELI